MKMISRKKLFSPLMASLLACSALTLGGCGLNREPPPRYNTVLGEKRPPVLNPNGQGLSGLPYASAPPYPIPPGPPPYPVADENMPAEDTVSVVPMPHTPQTMAGMPGSMEMEPGAPMQPYPTAPQQQEERGWFSGLTDAFSGGDENPVEQHAALPRKLPPGNREAFEQEQGVNAVPVEDVMSADMSAPLPMAETAETMADMPADAYPPMESVSPSEPLPMMTDSQGYPVLAETPPAPENTGARLESAQESLRDMESQQQSATQMREMQQQMDEAYAPPPAPPVTADAKPEQWRPVGEPVPQTAAAPLAPEPMVIQPEGWQSVPPQDSVAQPIQQPMPQAMTAPVYQPEPVQVVEDIPASTMAAEDGLPPINLIPPPSVMAENSPAVRTRANTTYMTPSRYEQRREAQRLRPFGQQ